MDMLVVLVRDLILNFMFLDLCALPHLSACFLSDLQDVKTSQLTMRSSIKAFTLTERQESTHTFSGWSAQVNQQKNETEVNGVLVLRRHLAPTEREIHPDAYYNSVITRGQYVSGMNLLGHVEL